MAQIGGRSHSISCGNTRERRDESPTQSFSAVSSENYRDNVTLTSRKFNNVQD